MSFLICLSGASTRNLSAYSAPCAEPLYLSSALRGTKRPDLPPHPRSSAFLICLSSAALPAYFQRPAIPIFRYSDTQLGVTRGSAGFIPGHDEEVVFCLTPVRPGHRVVSRTEKGLVRVNPREASVRFSRSRVPSFV